MRRHVRDAVSRVKSQLVQSHRIPRHKTAGMIRKAADVRGKFVSFFERVRLLYRLQSSSKRIEGMMNFVQLAERQIKHIDRQAENYPAMQPEELVRLMADRESAEMGKRFFSLAITNKGNIHSTMALLARNHFDFDEVARLLGQVKKEPAQPRHD